MPAAKNPKRLETWYWTRTVKFAPLFVFWFPWRIVASLYQAAGASRPVVGRISFYSREGAANVGNPSLAPALVVIP